MSTALELRTRWIARASKAALAFAFSAVLASCGGGGGSGAGAGGAGSAVAGGNARDSGAAVAGNGTGATATSTSGLMPSAPEPGVTLYADASKLRPFQAGATWNYRGTITRGSGTGAFAYVTSTTQSDLTTAGTAYERTSNSGDSGADSQTVTLTNGAISSTASVDFTGKDSPTVFKYVELRSPVRQGEQYNILDQHFSQTAIDADGDGKPDALDVAIYSEVIGVQTLQLPNLPDMQALEVDTTFLSRATYSSTGGYSPVVTSTWTTWYVAGIGIVRQTTTAPTTSGAGTQTTDEQISSWDGINTGLGAMPPVTAVVPATNGVYPGQFLPAPGLNAFAFGDHALVFTGSPGASGTLVSTVDLRGNVTRSKQLPSSFTCMTAVAAADRVLCLTPSTGGAYTSENLIQVDSSGNVLGSATLDLHGAHVGSYVTGSAAAVDGFTLWMLFGRWYYDPGPGNVPSNELILRPYSLDGVPLGPEVVVDTQAVTSISIAASSGQILMSWVRETGSGSAPYSQMYAAASTSGVGSVQSLVSNAPIYAFVSPLRLGPNSALLWSTPPGTNMSVGASGGILFDANMQPIRAGTTLLDEQIAGLVPYQGVPSTLGSRVVTLGFPQSATLWPGDQTAQSIDIVSWMDINSSPLATTPVNRVRMRSVSAQKQVVFPDRALVFGGTTNLTTTVVWLNKGT